MIQVSLPDGSQREFPGPVTVAEVAGSIGAGLAKAALAGRVNGKVVDTSFRLEDNSALSIITAKDSEGLEVIRHSTAHLLAYAVKELFPEAQVTIGPVIENGFFYDFSYKRPFTPKIWSPLKRRWQRWLYWMSPSPGGYFRVTKPWRISKCWASTTRPRSSRASPPTRMFHSTAKANSRTCAVGRTCPALAS